MLTLMKMDLHFLLVHDELDGSIIKIHTIGTKIGDSLRHAIATTTTTTCKYNYSSVCVRA